MNTICNPKFKLYGIVKYLLYLFIITYHIASHAQFEGNAFKKVLIEIDGEEVFDVEIITQDHQGYIWMGTNLGLIRYNGLEGKLYDSEKSEATSDYIETLYVDHLGELWIGAISGLSKYNLDCDCIYKYPRNIDNINLNDIRAITQDKNNNIWFGTRNGSLFLYEIEKDSFTTMPLNTPDSHTLAYNGIYHLLVDQMNNLWIGTDSGLVRFNISTGNVLQFSHNPSDPNSLLDNRISALYEDQRGQILVGTYKSGFHIYEPTTELLKRISFDANKPNQIHAPYSEDKVFGNDPYVRIIHQDQNGGYWIGTTGEGINYFNLETNTFNKYHFNLVNPQILWSIYEDRQGNLWLGGTMGSGLFRVDLFDRKYHLNTKITNPEFVYESPLDPGILWVSSQEYGLRKINIKTNTASGQTNFPNHLIFNHGGTPISIMTLNPEESSMHTDEFIMNGTMTIQDNKNLGANPAGHITQIYNTSTGSSADVLALKVGQNNPGSPSNFITFFGGNDAALGRIEGNGTGGVVFLSGGADFAEFIPTHLDEEDFSAGDVVGIVDGKISFNTTETNKVMVITDRPIVVGNQQEDDSNFQMVSFIGQVPVYVRGKVTAGDWIVASDLSDGTGIGIGAAEITLDHKIVGQAWESNVDPRVKRVNTVVGLDHSQAKDLIIKNMQQENKTQQLQISDLQQKIKDFQIQLIELKKVIIVPRS